MHVGATHTAHTNVAPDLWLLLLPVLQRGAAAQPHSVHPAGQSDGGGGTRGHDPAGELPELALACLGITALACTCMRTTLDGEGPSSTAGNPPLLPRSPGHGGTAQHMLSGHPLAVPPPCLS